MTILWSIAAFIVAISILVTIHEAGHFWVARWCNIKVRRFSIGFGRPLFRWHGRGPDHTEYVIAMIPLGGYVQMLDEREVDVSAEERPRAFNSRPLSQRVAVVIGGPAANFLFAIVAYWAVAVIGDVEYRPIIDQPTAGSPAAEAGLERGQEILRIDGRETPTWQRVAMVMLDVGFRHEALPVLVQEEDGREWQAELNLRAEPALRDTMDILGTVGLHVYTPRLDAVVGQLSEDGAAQRAGLQEGDQIIAVDGEPVKLWRDLLEQIEPRVDEEVTLTFLRDGAEQQRTVRLGSLERAGKEVGRLGIGPQVPEGYRERMMREVRYGPVAGLWNGVERTWETSSLTLKMLGRMIIGEASLKNIGGPVTIGQFAGETASIGITPFLFFLALISVTLGVVNLLPIPVLDGGHLLYYAVEGARGRPLSEHAQMIGQRIGIVMIVAFMGLALYNDFYRLLG